MTTKAIHLLAILNELRRQVLSHPLQNMICLLKEEKPRPTTEEELFGSTCLTLNEE